MLQQGGGGGSQSSGGGSALRSPDLKKVARMSAISIVVARMDIHKLCQDEKQISPTQFYNSAITVISILIAGELLLGCACLLLLRRSSSVSGAEGGASRQLAEINWLGKIKAICMHGIISSKGFFSAEQFRQVFLIVLAPARFDSLAFFAF
jgi:hypothetical protein